MAWNRPSEANQQRTSKSGTKAPSVYRGIIAGTVVVMFGALCFFLFSGKNEAPAQKADKERGRIKEVTPAAAPTNKVEVVTEKVEEKPYWEWDESQTNRLSPGKLKMWKRRREPLMKVEHTERPLPRFAIFEHRFENELAFLLTIEPGTNILGAPYYKGMEEDFVASAIDKIEIKDDDDEYTRNLKLAVIEAKKEVSRRVKDGENLITILKDTREEMQRLAVYKQNLSADLREMIKGCETDEEIETAVDAANKMLEDKGIAPLKKSFFLKTKMKYIKEGK